MSKSKILASLAVFRKLYNEKEDVFNIISKFLLQVIIEEDQYSFNLTEITHLFNEYYSFKIPEAVIKTTLSKLKTQGILDKKEEYICYKEKFDNYLKNDFQKNDFQSAEKENNELIEALFLYIEKENKKLIEEQKNDIKKALINFILEEDVYTEYTQLISAFLIEKGKEFRNILIQIKQGAVLYQGITYTADLNELKWENPLTIFLDTEILFYLLGYNGEISQKISNEFYDCVKEINRKTKDGKKKIQLCYFKEIKQEIENYFCVAEEIVEGKKLLEPGKTAMKLIVNGCKEQSDVIVKKANFYENLVNMGISEHMFDDYFNKKYHRYNIEGEKTESEISYEEEIANKVLNYTSILRGKDGTLNNNFENIGYIFLSGTSIILKLSWHKIKLLEEDKKSVPLATTLDFLTSRFWFRLNKGFGDEKNPLTFDLITKAKCILSNKNNQAITEQFEELQEKLKEGNITEEVAKSEILQLRRKECKPEDIAKDNCSDIISEDEIREYEDDLGKANRDKEILKQTNSFKENKIKEHKDEVEKTNRENEILKQTNIELKKQILEKQEGEMEQLKEKERELIKKEKDEIKKSTTIYIVVIISPIILGIVFNNYGWLVGLFVPLLGYLYIVCTGKNFNPKEIMDDRKKMIKKKIFGDFYNTKDKLKEEIELLQKEINNYNKE